MKKIAVVLFSVLLSSSAFASGFESRIQKSAESWTKSGQTTARGGSITNEDVVEMQKIQTPGVQNGPVGDTAWVLVLGMSLAYGAYSLVKRRKEA